MRVKRSVGEVSTDDGLIAEDRLDHICVEVDEIDAAIADLRNKGVRLLGDEPRQGSTGRIIFVDAASSHGVSIELLEKAR